MDYETLDTIADAYIPLLAGLYLFALVWTLSQLPGQRRAVGASALILALMLLASYGLMFLDNWLKLWPGFGLDYSTHTAVSFSLVLALCMLKRRLWPLWLGSFIGYLALMHYQQYHTVADMLTTLIALIWLPLLISAVLRRGCYKR